MTKITCISIPKQEVDPVVRLNHSSRTQPFLVIPCLLSRTAVTLRNDAKIIKIIKYKTVKFNILKEYFLNSHKHHSMLFW